MSDHLTVDKQMTDVYLKVYKYYFFNIYVWTRSDIK